MRYNLNQQQATAINEVIKKKMGKKKKKKGTACDVHGLTFIYPYAFKQIFYYFPGRLFFLYFDYSGQEAWG
jgi:hypothetical protein